ncbi:lamin tail domain-containing protein [candidate division KSB1 bacterium]|nr:lamin tail domain-containing protein [candidate division KSB1 bacterium]
MKFLPIFLCLMLTASGIFAANEIVINEIMYNSPGDDVEFVEIYNNSDHAVNLDNWYLLDDNDEHPPCLLTGTLAAGDYLVIAENVTMFQEKYPDVTKLNTNAYGTGSDGWSFGNSSDEVRLYDGTGDIHDKVTYEDGGLWPTTPDGDGPSLELLHPSLDNTMPDSWKPSTKDGGTPGDRNSVFTDNIPPTCIDVTRRIGLPTHSDSVPVSVTAFDPEGLAKVELFVNTGSGYVAQLMSNDGTSGDAVAGDSIFTAIIAPQAGGTLVKYYAVATDAEGQTNRAPIGAPSVYSAYTVDHVVPKLRITEILPANNSVIDDEAGEYDDWFEIQNQDTKSVNLAGMYVSDAMNDSMMFRLPSITLSPGQFTIIWADDDVNQGSRHANFRMSADGEEVALFETIDHGNVLIHGWKYGVISPDVSMGFPTNQSTAPEYLSNPTPGQSNETSPLFSQVCINEFQSTSDFGGPDDWVEIYNRGSAPFNLSGCYLSDQRSKNTKWRFPANTILDPGAYLVIYEDVLGFGFSSEGDDVIILTASDSTTGLDFYDFNAQKADYSEGRFPDGTSSWRLFNKPTRGSSNLISAVENNHQTSIPKAFLLNQNFPNPFNSATVVSYDLPRNGRVKIKIYTLLGGYLKTLVDEIQEQGRHKVLWDGTDDSGRTLPSGMFFIQMQVEDFRQTRKMILIK